ncbi:hypothetical protein [Streptomyces sp. NPDC002328]|uniref:hypothetical protein n=1 Tax=Streptomyces sp. NPDC002328 TaxID=3364642 RepID=UPI003685C8CC
MDAIPFALDGYLAADPEPGDREGTVSWRLTCSAGTDHLVEEAVIPCTTMEPGSRTRYSPSGSPVTCCASSAT